MVALAVAVVGCLQDERAVQQLLRSQLCKDAAHPLVDKQSFGVVCSAAQRHVRLWHIPAPIVAVMTVRVWRRGCAFSLFEPQVPVVGRKSNRRQVAF
eukprot:425930-Rhodomonas_salina.1